MAKVQGVKPTKATREEVVLSDYYKLVQRRYKIAKEIYEAQDGLTKEILDRIRDRLLIASTGVIAINGRPVKIEQKYIDYNILFLACEVLGDLALHGIQIGNFEPHPAWCAECRKEIMQLPRDHKYEREVKKVKKARR